MGTSTGAAVGLGAGGDVYMGLGGRVAEGAGIGAGVVGAVGPSAMAISAQFQNCSGTPLPSGGRGPQRPTLVFMLPHSVGNGYELYPGKTQLLAVK